MNLQAQSLDRQYTLEPVVQLIQQKLSHDEAALLEQFVWQYYANIAIEDLNTRSTQDLYGAALAHWRFSKKRSCDSQVGGREKTVGYGEYKVRVYNPKLAKYHWQSRHTIVEVVCDDMPFLIDSLRMKLAQMDYVYLMSIHVAMHLQRDENNLVYKILPRQAAMKKTTDAFIAIEIPKESDKKALEKLEQALSAVLAQVSKVTRDWQAMRQAMELAREDHARHHSLFKIEDYQETQVFLKWLLDNNFTFLGYREYALEQIDNENYLSAMTASGLGIFQDAASQPVLATPEKATVWAQCNDALIIDKAGFRATVHRPGYADYIGLKRFDDQGKVLGEYRFIGLFTSRVYHCETASIPIVRGKVRYVLKKAGLPQHGHDNKALVNLLETYPRDELFQTPIDTLYDIAMGILHLQGRQRIKLFIRRDSYAYFYSCFVFIPRERFTTELRIKAQQVLATALKASEIEFNSYFSESPLVQVHYLVHSQFPPETVNVSEIESRIIAAIRTWWDEFEVLALEKFGSSKGHVYLKRYKKAFPLAYQDRYKPSKAIADVQHMATLTQKETDVALSFYSLPEGAAAAIHFKLFTLSHPIPLSDILPILENMGLKVIGERLYEIKLHAAEPVWVHDFSMEYRYIPNGNAATLKCLFEESFLKIWSGQAGNDGFNRLMFQARLNWREIMLLRSYARYMRQIGFTFSQSYIEQSMAANRLVSGLLVKLFNARLNPNQKGANGKLEKKYEKEINRLLEGIANLDEDRIIRLYRDLIQATVRTNYYQLDNNGEHKPYLSLKFKPSAIPNLPLPVPQHEIFVYSTCFEAVHLRGGKVARGGLRWSDRREDFRTEILGLLKAQQVKNAGIVPVGAKGGFVCKKLPTAAGRSAVAAEVDKCYKQFICGLLDITDNRVDGLIKPPTNVRRLDEDDAYLVVAADKGTATFSDKANQIAKAYGFWLGDAFASGGSAGFDHKKMGITSKGAWLSVVRHFKEMGKDVHREVFQVVAIGDMSGDVFGNGMLMTDKISLQAAFDHQYIFLDPKPKPNVSYQERKRLFALPRSNWSDYDPSLISNGGGVFSRKAKTIKISKSVRAFLKITAKSLEPTELINALLKAPVDLIWNGGIGTFVKASSESHLQVGDRTNDVLRVNGNQLRCKVFGEGGNLGMTQRGRIEYALNCGRLNTDFIDNGGGVNCSDHEVNIKILLNTLILSGKLTEKLRNKLLKSMIDEVAALVLNHCDRQSQAISLAQSVAERSLGEYKRLIEALEKKQGLNRELEALPNAEQLTTRSANGLGFTRPELAVMLCYSKAALKQELLSLDILDITEIAQALTLAFPRQLSKKYRDSMQNHQLRREIIATQVANRTINEMSATFVHRLRDETGANTATIIAWYHAARLIFNLPAVWAEIDALDAQVSPVVRYEMILSFTRLVRRATRWFIRNRSDIKLSKAIEFFTAKTCELERLIPTLLDDDLHQQFIDKVAIYVAEGVPEGLATRCVATSKMLSALDVLEAARKSRRTVKAAASVYFKLGELLELHWFRDQISIQPVTGYWQAMARAASRDDLDRQQRNLTISVLRSSVETGSDKQLTENWLNSKQSLANRWSTMLADVKVSGVQEFAVFSVALRELDNLMSPSSA